MIRGSTLHTQLQNINASIQLPVRFRHLTLSSFLLLSIINLLSLSLSPNLHSPPSFNFQKHRLQNPPFLHQNLQNSIGLQSKSNL
ncbi:hypothetical protein C1H46_010996 [Malus baccata]|uniref:Uncharacterized protein n=1 Tax=Malus baccata TaxID=106549 RepID=A0A540MXB3_MALBA|nr:hypothetical protein C1H46_010996 [Malus baccata]